MLIQINIVSFLISFSSILILIYDFLIYVYIKLLSNLKNNKICKVLVHCIFALYINTVYFQ